MAPLTCTLSQKFPHHGCDRRCRHAPLEKELNTALDKNNAGKLRPCAAPTSILELGQTQLGCVFPDGIVGSHLIFCYKKAPIVLAISEIEKTLYIDVLCEARDIIFVRQTKKRDHIFGSNN